MSRAQRFIVLKDPSLAEQYADYITSLAPLLWLRFRETSGTDVANSGSIAATGAWTAGAGAVGQTGKLGVNEAYDLDGADSKVQFASADIASLKALTTQRGMILVFLDSLGESSAGTIWTWVDFSRSLMRVAGTNRLYCVIDAATTNAEALTSNNEISDFIGAWRLIFWDYDDTDAMGLGRKIRLFKSVPGSGVITLLTLGTDTAAVGAVTAPNVDYVVGNVNGQTNTTDGRIDELIHTSGLWTPADDPDDYSAMETISLLTPA